MTPIGRNLGFAHARQSTSASFRFFKMEKRIDIANDRGKSAKKRITSRIFSNPC